MKTEKKLDIMGIAEGLWRAYERKTYCYTRGTYSKCDVCSDGVKFPPDLRRCPSCKATMTSHTSF